MAVLEIEEPADGVRLLRLNRPDKHNALDTALTQALLDALRDAGRERCRAVILTGAGASFCAGADTTEFSALSGDDQTLATARADLTAQLHAVFTEIGVPVIAAVHGNALGGGAGLALACDIVIAAEDMMFGYPELRHGVVPAIVMANLVRQIGRKAAFRLVATGRIIGGEEAERLGIVSESVPPELVSVRAMEIASRIAAWSPVAMRATKRLFHRVAELPIHQALEAGRDANVIMRGFSRSKGAS